jgi:hypothetical protein
MKQRVLDYQLIIISLSLDEANQGEILREMRVDPELSAVCKEEVHHLMKTRLVRQEGPFNLKQAATLSTWATIIDKNKAFGKNCPKARIKVQLDKSELLEEVTLQRDKDKEWFGVDKEMPYSPNSRNTLIIWLKPQLNSPSPELFLDKQMHKSGLKCTVTSKLRIIFKQINPKICPWCSMTLTVLLKQEDRMAVWTPPPTPRRIFTKPRLKKQLTNTWLNPQWEEQQEIETL